MITFNGLLVQLAQGILTHETSWKVYLQKQQLKRFLPFRSFRNKAKYNIFVIAKRARI